MHLVFDLRLIYIALGIWLNLFLIIKINSYSHLIILFIGCFIYIFLKRDYLLEIVLLIILLISSTLSIYSRVNTLNQEITNDLINERSLITVTAETKSDLLLRTNKNPYTNQDYWEVFAKTQAVKNDSESWQVSLPVIFSFSQLPERLDFGTKVQVTGSIVSSYRPDKAFLVRVEELTVIEKPQKMYYTINIFRDNFSNVAKSTNHNAAGLIPGLVSGDTQLQTKEFSEAMQSTGLTHLTAVSGGNIAILLAVFVWFLRILTLRRKAIFVLSLVLLGIFLILVRFEPSALRATVMGLIGVWSLTFGGPRTSIGALNFSIVFLLLIDPFLATNWGFILSVAATSGLILIAPLIQRIWTAQLPNTPKFLLLLISMTLSAQIITYPFIGFMVGEVSLVSLLANALAMPTVAWVTVFGFLALITATLWPATSSIFIYLALPGAIWIETVATNLARLPFAQVTFSPSAFFAVVAFIGAVVVYRFRKSIMINLLRERLSE